MGVKAFTFSGEKPPESVSADGVHVGLLGYLWDPKDDKIKLDIKELYLEKPKRGKLPELVKGDISQALQKSFTRRTLTGKVAGVFDPLGLASPITSKFKLDLHELCQRKLDWDDQVPGELLSTWVDNLEKIQDLRKISFNRTIIPADALNTQVQLIISVDASQDICVAAAHSRILLKDGSYECQLVMAKTKIVSSITIPKAELKGALTGAVISHIVKQNLGEQFSKCTYVTDSSIVLYWIHQDERPLQVGVRNAVIQIRRFSEPNQWFHIKTEDNIADLGTRPASVNEIDEGSEWQTGKKWMRGPEKEMPVQSMEDLTLSNEEKKIAAEEIKARDIQGHVLSTLTNKIGDRYSFSKYVVDPCVLSWPKSVRVLAYVKRFINNLKAKLKCVMQRCQDSLPTSGTLTDEEVSSAENYFYKKGTREVKQFSKPRDWKDCSYSKDQILYYTGRILDGQEVYDPESTMLDLDPLTFVRPILDRYSPVAYSIMIHCHQSVAHHMNSIATLRESRSIAFILQGRDLANEIRDSCVHCRRYKAKFIEARMGKLHET